MDYIKSKLHLNGFIYKSNKKTAGLKESRPPKQNYEKHDSSPITEKAERIQPFLSGASCRIRTNDPEITNHVLWPTELKRQVGELSASHRSSQYPCFGQDLGDSRRAGRVGLTRVQNYNIFPNPQNSPSFLTILIAWTGIYVVDWQRYQLRRLREDFLPGLWRLPGAGA